MNKRRLVIVVLIVSLTINLLFVGALIGRWAWGPRTHPFEPHFGWLVRRLDEQTRADLKPVIKRQAEQLAPLRRDMREAQIRFNEALASDPLDEEALDAALGDLRENSTAIQAIMHEQMMTVVKRMDLEERQKLARFLRRHAPGERRRPRQGIPP